MLENFDFRARPSVNRPMITELTRCEYINKRENVLLVGNPGTGKTHLLHAIAHHAISQEDGPRVVYMTVEQFVNELMSLICCL